MDSDVSGIFSAIANIKTEKAKSTVTPRAIFSPESGGKQNTKTVSVLIIIQGNTMLYLKVKIYTSKVYLEHCIEYIQANLNVVMYFIV